MNFSVITLFPEMIQNACSYSILARAIKDNLISVDTINPRDFTTNKHKKVDDTPYGGGAGMVLAPQPIFDAYRSISKKENSRTVLLTPQGCKYNHNLAKELSSFEQIILICGHYEGFDERIRQNLTDNLLEISVGDFVLTGGELAALCIIDSVSRFVPNILGADESKDYDSFADGLLEYPQYTKPRDFESHHVPEVLLNGNHKDIEIWRRKQQILRTKDKRPDLFEQFLSSELSKQDLKILKELNLFTER